MIEQTLAALTAAITENTAALREVLAASGAPTNVTPIQDAPKAAKKKAEKVEPVKEEPAAVVEPEPVAEETPEPETTPEPEPENTLDPEALIAQITDAWKATLTAADPERKVMLKAKFPELRAKWGLEADAKLITLSSTPEKLAGLLADIKSL
jgi:hypothetical protein